MTNNITRLMLVPLKRVIDVEAEDITPEDDQAAAIERYVDCIMAVNPAFDRGIVRYNIKEDLRELVNDNTPRYYKWRLVNGQYIVEHPSVYHERIKREYDNRPRSESDKFWDRINGKL